MTLDDLRKNKAYQVGEVKSNLHPAQVEMSEDFWLQAIACHHPHLLYWGNMEERQVRYFIFLLDRVIQDDVPGVAVTDSQKSEAEDAREELLDML